MGKRQRKRHGGRAAAPRRTGAGVEEGSGNVFADLGLPDPGRRLGEARARAKASRGRRGA